MNLVITITVRASAEMDAEMEGAANLASRIEDETWDALRSLTEDIAHVDVEIDPERDESESEQRAMWGDR